MDLRTHFGIVWRWRLVVALGLLLAVVLTLLSVCRVSFAHGISVSYRQGQTWQGSETLLLSYQNQLLSPSDVPTNITGLTSLYVSIANSATIRTRVLPNGRPTKKSGDYNAFQVFDQNNSPQPIMTFNGTGSSASLAASVARRASLQFRQYLSSQFQNAEVPSNKRVRVSIITPAQARDAKVAKGRKYTAPILVFIAVLLATLGLVYLLENLRPRKASGQRRGRQAGSAQAAAKSLRERTAAPVPTRAEARQVETTRRP